MTSPFQLSHILHIFVFYIFILYLLICIFIFLHFFGLIWRSSCNIAIPAFSPKNQLNLSNLNVNIHCKIWLPLCHYPNLAA